MRPIRRGVAALLAGLALLAATPSAPACGYGLPSPGALIIRSDLALVGRVAAVEEKTVSASVRGRENQTAEHRIAVLEVVRGLKGVGDVTHVKVGLLPHQTARVGQVSLFYLLEHAEAPFYVYTDAYDYPADGAPNDTAFRAQVERLARYGRILEFPDAALDSCDARERYEAAVLMLTRATVAARSGRRGQPALPPVTFTNERLRRVMDGLAEGDWDVAFEDFDMTPWAAAAVLRPGPQDGFPAGPFAKPGDQAAAIKGWLRANAATYRIKAG